MSLRVAQLKDGRRAIIIRTSDRIAFKQCRRKWGWSSHLKRNLGPAYLASPLWFGSAIHYALEDFHGERHFDRAADAFRAYCIATSKQYLRELPPDAQEHYKLGIAMMDYYQDEWLRFRKADQTYYDNGVPQTEVNFEIPVPLEEHPHLEALAKAHGADCVLYRGTIDRVAIDEEGNLWVVEYKTAKRAEHLHYQTDPQVTTYVWAATHIYDRPVAGVVYQQFIKEEPKPPRLLSTTGRISTASNLATSAPLYRRQLENMYGTVSGAPEANINYLYDLEQKESPDKDRYIQRVRVYRNPVQTQHEAVKILMELEDMLNPDLPLYPNPTRDCSRMCSFLGACVSMDDGGDWNSELDQEFSERDQAADRLWRDRMPSPEVLKKWREEGLEEPNLEGLQMEVRALRKAQIEAGELDSADDTEFTFG